MPRSNRYILPGFICMVLSECRTDAWRFPRSRRADTVTTPLSSTKLHLVRTYVYVRSWGNPSFDFFTKWASEVDSHE